MAARLWTKYEYQNDHSAIDRTDTPDTAKYRWLISYEHTKTSEGIGKEKKYRKA